MMLETEKVDSFSFLPPVDNLETSENHRYFPFRLPVDNLENGKNTSTFSVSESEENTYLKVWCFPHDVKGKK